MNSIARSKNVDIFDPTPLLSNRVQKYAPGAIRRLLPLESLPGMISLVAGKPNPEVFPFEKITLSLKGSNEEIILTREDGLVDGLQYGLPGGNPELVRWFEGFQSELHGIDRNQGWSCCIGNGSQELLHRTFQVLTDPGDPVLIETPAYPGVVGFLQAEDYKLVQAKTDRHGLEPSKLEKSLSQWPEDLPLPKLLYTIPTGSNPTGRSCPEWRKIEILRLAKRYNFMILEDDAYYFLNFENEPQGKPRSYLALEQEVNGETGRVVRFDSMSKIVSAGMRLGVLTGPLPIVKNVIKLTENINLQPSSTTQILALSLFRHWGHTGFLDHCARASDFYRRKRDVFAAAAEMHLKYRATWDLPTAGLFFWLTLTLPPGGDTFELLSKKGMERGLLAIPGVAFMPDNRKTYQLRASFSLVTEEQAYEACRRIAQLVDDAWGDWVREFVPGRVDRKGLSNPTTTVLA
ncbi:PLP-dependent transferase [Annulohypoxylon maeteangense]|uniref:PLP-dependent transferase n=1 Tax=Annulohypoxylon maeteangense TaxID=1927788 RepID=UPI002007539B|nr:PLP-dependent transferase [Annulohypoxylon maeteangense]KAI0885912.1 PLP-dependent transferase [Annulohypoxylon maeteangense]